MIDWIDIKKQRPERGVEVLAWVDDHRGPAWMNNHAEIVYLENNGKFYNWDNDKEYSVLYWSPLSVPDKSVVEALHPDMSKLPEFDIKQYLKDREEYLKNKKIADTVQESAARPSARPAPTQEQREAIDVLNRALTDLKNGFVVCERCGHQEPADTLDAYWMIEKGRDALLARKPTEEVKGSLDLATACNSAILHAVEALRYLADNDRPIGGNDFPNTETCYMIADDLERLLQHAPRSKPVEEEVNSISDAWHYDDRGDRIRMACEFYKNKVGDPRPLRAFSKINSIINKDSV